MTTEVQLEQSSFEEKIYPLDYGPALLSGVTVEGVDVTHEPPSGTPLTVDTEVDDDGIGYVSIPKDLAIGVHQFSCVAETSNPDHSPEILLVITVMR